MKRLLMLACGLLFSASAQLQFEEMSHNFGTVQEGEKATHVFYFNNVGKDEQQLHNVKASCGCTTPAWTKGPVKPGEKGKIEVTYNSKGRPGPFTKSITVTYDTSSTGRPIILTIKGVVAKAESDATVPATPTEPSVQYEETQGNLQIEKKRIMAGIVASNQDNNFAFMIKNSGAQPIKLMGLKDTEPFYNLSWAKTLLNPGESTVGTISTVNDKAEESNLKNKVGFNHVLTFETNDATQPLKTIEVAGTFKKVYTEAELSALPRIDFPSKDFDGGEILQGDKLSHTFTFRNTGGKPLKLNSVKASCGCTTPAWTKDEIAPGASGKIDVVFNSAGKKGPQHKTIVIRSNDPETDTVILHIKCTVLEDPFSAPDSTAPVNPNGDN